MVLSERFELPTLRFEVKNYASAALARSSPDYDIEFK
jgi:hypothetical protein